MERLFKVEWTAQELLKRFEKSGPLIEPIINITPYNASDEEFISKPTNYLIIQGSFDPPTTSHIEILSKAISFRLNMDPSEAIKVMFLLSLSHVDKKLNVLNRSLLGNRVEMLKDLLPSLKLKLPIIIGLSNVARYIDLIKAINHSFNDLKDIFFIMGMDVFKKLLDPIYYSKSLEEVLILIFKADYIVAGREEVFTKEEFDSYLINHLPTKYHKKVHFLSLPESYRFLNATSIRERYFRNQPVENKYIHSTIRKYLENNNIYNSTSKWIATKIAIQTVVQLTLEADLDQIIAIKILRNLIHDIQDNASLQKQLIDDYRTEKNTEISKRWEKLLTLI